MGSSEQATFLDPCPFVGSEPLWISLSVSLPYPTPVHVNPERTEPYLAGPDAIRFQVLATLVVFVFDLPSSSRPPYIIPNALSHAELAAKYKYNRR
jgi:hypothetical protein